MDNKYANLIGIARNEPDVYETPNPTSNEKLPVIEEDSKLIEKIIITTKDAHQIFNTGSLNSDYVDFSDTITSRRKFGYRVEPDSYEWNQDLVENPIQRFKRLEAELTHLKNDLNEMDKLTDEDTDKQLVGFDPITLAKQVEELQDKVKTLHLETIGAKVDINKLNNKAKKDLLYDNLNALKKDLAHNEKAKTSDDSCAIVFKLFSDLEASDMTRADKIAELTQRLGNLEAVFGAGNASVNERQISKLCNNIENKSLLGLVESLNSKMNLVEKQSLEQVETRLQAVVHRISQLNEKKLLVEEQEKLSKVSELYGMVCKWKDISAVVPVVVERLSALNEIHQKAFEFPLMLSRLDAEQEAIKQNLNTSNDVLKNLEKSLEANIESIQKNFAILNEKILAD